MLDLNVDMESSHLQNQEDSDTSNSSVVNFEDSSALVFDIMKKKDTNFNHEITHEITTRPLFPVKSDDEKGPRRDCDVKLGFSCSRSNQWLNLSFSERAGGGGNQGELRVLQQKQPQIRKSRRGPRSRSSQYRGVTFYRRTGRWESHIW